MFRLRSFWLTVVGLSVAVAVLLNPVLHLPAKGEQSAPGGFDLVSVQPTVKDPDVPGTVLNPVRYGTGLQRTLYLLASSTPTRRNTVRILFYGQSITKQDWWLEVVNRLRERFPDANLIVENRAIGGFASHLLVRAAEHDLYSFYPDLVIFQCYGDEKNYEAIVANIKQKTTAEIALISDHIDWLPGEPTDKPEEVLNIYRWHNQHVQWLSKTAEKYGAEFIDIRTPWEDYLKNNHLSASVMLIDEAGHLNDKGNRLMAQLVSQHLLQSPIASTRPTTPTVVNYPQNSLRWQNGKLKLEFQGNRIDVVTRTTAQSGSASATVLIDGKRPSQFPDLYHLTRPSDSFHVDIPAIIRVQSQAPLQLEDWSLFVTEINPEMTRFKFQVYGSKTGFDGEGVSTERFVSRSRRIVIEPQEWNLLDTARFFKRPIPTGFQIRWQVDPLFTDVYVPPVVQERSREVVTTLAQNLTNSRHVLELTSNTGKPIPLDAIRVYRPDSRVARID